jgi:uncharacterized protein (DUF1919 family)
MLKSARVSASTFAKKKERILAMRLQLKIRRKLSILMSLKLIPKLFSIISDDCWGGQVYRQLRIPYLTPTVGLWIRPQDYLDYVENLDRIHQEDLIFVQSKKDYPIATLSGIELNFMHFDNELEAKEKYMERYARIERGKLLVKIDFGKPGYTKSDMERWNRLRIPNSVAFYPPSSKIPAEGVHNGIEVRDWVPNGSRMFNITRRYFDVFNWIRNGRIKNGLTYRFLNIVLLDPTSPRRIGHKLLEAMSLRRRAAT